MSLSSEDALRLNVLLANKPQAIRIDESSMTLFGLSDKGEAKIKLNPNCRDDLYLRKVREVLSGHVQGSPGGYPVYLKRWSRMGQTRDENLEQLLLLGEPEAVVAFTCAQGITDELARRAWWTRQDPDNARRMLDNPQVVKGKMGPELARFLIEYLPFETEPIVTIESLRLALQPGLISREERVGLWKRCQRRPTYYLGFLTALPDHLPETVAARALSDQELSDLQALATIENPFASQLLRIYSSSGQGFLKTVLRVIEKPANQDVVTLLLDVLRDYLVSLRPTGAPDLTLAELQAEAQTLDSDLFEACRCVVNHRDSELRTLYLLSGLSYGVVRPVFSKTDAIGTLMRKKLEPIIEPLKQQLMLLQGSSAV
ncbi:MAG: sulfur reduction protein DsrS [Candidatus Thiodiazotropha sp. (ex Lucinoma borealis)]|nr:sulfur reduction protein DsrS [Candidatus Thiodiazotropha sp. (ex Lucinoma borealis)]